MNAIQIFANEFKARSVLLLVKYYFGIYIPPGQEQIVKSILYPEHKRICINAMTRYGKTYALAIAVLLYILFNKNKKIAVIAPTKPQAEILRTYLSDLIVENKTFYDLVDMSKSGVERLKKEASRTRQTFKNGCEYRVFSAEGEADRLMGFGANGLVIVDEACLIPQIAWAKISRMLGDAPKDTKLIELSNPWDRATQYFKDWTSNDFLKIHIDYKQAIREKRTTAEFIEEQRRRLTKLEFQVLYESIFPDQSEDSLFNYEKVIAGTRANFEFKEIQESIIGADIADKGLDSTVIMHATSTDDYFIIDDIYSESKSENTAVAGRIVANAEKYAATKTNIDTIGVGVGVVSMVKERKVHSKTKVNACHFGESASDTKRFLNKKAEQYFRLNDLFNQGKIKIPNHEKLISELLSMKWEYTSSGKIRIVDPEKSPDFADALVYTVWKTNKHSYGIA